MDFTRRHAHSPASVHLALEEDVNTQENMRTMAYAGRGPWPSYIFFQVTVKGEVAADLLSLDRPPPSLASGPLVQPVEQRLFCLS